VSRRVNLPGVDELFGGTEEAAPAARALTAVPTSGMPALRVPEPDTQGSTGRVRHNEKITVYMSADELLDLEHARLMLRRDYGVAVDRGRIVREALDIALAEITSDGSASPLVRRLAGGPLSTDPDLAAGAEPTSQ
jgi:hypothetical protein